MSPYYSDDAVTIYHGDCCEVLAWLEADVLITDPPYGTGSVGRYGRGLPWRPPGVIANDNGTETRDNALTLWGARPACVFGSPRRPDPPITIADRPGWDKTRLGMNGGPSRYRHASIYAPAGFTRTNDAACSIIEAFPDQSEHIHAKPHTLMLRLVEAAPPGVIADPFMGSGSTLVAAKACGRRSIGIEVDERYCEIAAKRMAQEVLDFGGAA